MGKTKWGALLAGIGGIAAIVGKASAEGRPPSPEEWGLIATIIGSVIGAFGVRDAIKENTNAVNKPSGVAPPPK